MGFNWLVKIFVVQGISGAYERREAGLLGINQYIKILTVCVTVCVSVCNGSGMFVGRDYTIVTRDLCTSRTQRGMFGMAGIFQNS